VRKNIASLPACPHCGASAHHEDDAFCCGASLSDSQSTLPAWQWPAPDSHIAMSRIALSCLECGSRCASAHKVCRRCGARLVMIPRLLHPNHFRLYVAGPRTALAELVVDASLVVIGVLALNWAWNEVRQLRWRRRRAAGMPA
jgi:hypothetical protein